MPEINLNTLNNFPRINVNTVQQMTQNNQNACGAFALVAAVGAFGVFPMNLQIAQNLNQLALIFGLIARNYRFGELAKAVYELSGILNPNPAPGDEIVALQMPNIYPTDGYNSLAVLAGVARSLGRQVSINATQQGFQNLAQQYPGERARCEAVVGQQNVHVGTPQDPVNYQVPAIGATQVIVVIGNAGMPNQTLHMVARGSVDGNGTSTYYDPGTGMLQLNWGDPTDDAAFLLNTTNTGTQYKFGGVWMTIT